MAVRQLADLLPDFGPASPPARPAPAPSVEPMPVQNFAAPSTAPSIDEIVASEVALAEARVRTQMAAEFEATRAQDETRYQIELASLHEALGNQAGEKIANAFAEAQRNLTELTTTTAARILSTLLTEDVTRRSVEDLARTIRTACADRSAVRIKVLGPQSMFEALQQQLGPLGDQCDFAEAPGFDLTVAIDTSLFETRLTEWSAAIGGAIT